MDEIEEGAGVVASVGRFVNIVIEEGAGVVATVGLLVNIRIDEGANVGADVIDAKVGFDVVGCDVVGSLVATVELKVGTDVIGAAVGEIVVPILVGT